MAITLIVNTGSSSKKYALYREGREVLFVSVVRDQDEIRYSVRKNDAWVENVAITEAEFQESVERVVQSARKYGCIVTPTDIQYVGVRVVAPGKGFQHHQLLTADVLEELRAVTAAAPLHIPPTLKEIKSIRSVLSEAILVAVSDSAYHSTMPVCASTYSIPEIDRATFGLQRYGYHGLSVSSVINRVHAVTGQNLSRVVVCHLGSGASVTAVKDGLSLDTSMGFSPGSGLPMGSRAGDLETGALLELMRLKQMNPHDAYTYIQTRGGFRGLTDESDIRHLLERAAKQEERVIAAFDRFAHAVKKQIGGMMAILGGVDGVVITATAGERSPVLRHLCLRGLEDLGIIIDEDKNNEIISKDGVISPTGSEVKVVVIKTGEMEEMQRITEQIATEKTV